MKSPTNLKLKKAVEDFIRHWGEMGYLWGINKAMGQIHALLICSPEPLSLDDICGHLGISRGNASTNVRELRNWGVVKMVYRKGDRRNYYAAEDDVWKVLIQIAKERKRRELEPTIYAISNCLAQIKQAGGHLSKPERQMAETLAARLRRLQSVARAINDMLDRFVRGEKVDLAPLRRIVVE